MGKEPAKTTNLCMRVPTGIYEIIKAECGRNNEYANATDFVVCALREYIKNHGITKDGRGGGGLIHNFVSKKLMGFTGHCARC